jgi:hypothetical protein
MDKIYFKKSPLLAILFFLLLLPSVIFFQSKKILLWKEKTEDEKRNFIEAMVLAGANFSEILKRKLGGEDLFAKEHLFWLKLKTSPVLFEETEKENQEIKEEKLTREKSPIEKETQIEESKGEISPEKAENEITQSQELIPKEFQSEGEMKILIIGDSMVAVGGGLGEMLEKELKKEFKEAKILREGKVSSGLSRPDYFNWEKRTAQLLSQFQPNIGMVVFGTNDVQALTTPEGKVVVNYLKFGQKDWDEEYAKRVDRILEILKEKEVFVFWIGLPIMKNPALSQKIAHLNSIFEKETQKFENSYFISTWSLLSDEQGNYTDYLLDEKGVRKLVRTSDGIHLQYFGGKIVSQEIIKIMKTIFHLSEKL